MPVPSTAMRPVRRSFSQLNSPLPFTHMNNGPLTALMNLAGSNFTPLLLEPTKST